MNDEGFLGPDGLDVLRGVLATAQAAMDRAGRLKAVADLLADAEAIQGIGATMADCPFEVEAVLVGLEAVQGLTPSVSRLRSRLREIADETRTTLRLAAREEERALVQLAEHLPAIDIPYRYLLDEAGLQVMDEGSLTRLTHRPILPSCVLTDVETGRRSVEIAWRDEVDWQSRVVPASTAQDVRAFVGLMSDEGAPVAAHNGAALARFIDETVEVNRWRVPREWSTTRMGWLRNGELGFALGDRVIGSQGVRVCLDPEGSEAQTAAALAPRGSESAWIEAVRMVTPYPSVMIALYAAICAPLLAAIPSAPNPIIGWCGETSTGKTTGLRMSASVWGDPAGLIQKWNQTATFLERAATFSNFLPVCCDDTNDVAEAHRDTIPRMLYQWAGGRGRGRATITGTQRTATWRSPLLSTGEASLTSYSQDAGTRSRSLVLSRPPFGDEPQARLVSDLTLACLDHHGHLGPRIVERLLSCRAAWPLIEQRYTARCEALAADATSHATQRLGRIVALLEEARRLGEACGLPAAECDPIGYAWEAARVCGEDSDRPRAALMAVFGWAVAHQSEFWGRHLEDRDGTPRQPPRGWAGKWDRESWDRLAFVPDCLDRILRYHHYDPGAVVPLWEERGWLLTSEGRRTCRVRIDREHTRCVAISREAINTIEG